MPGKERPLVVWIGWPLARIVILLVGLAYFLIAVQTAMFHHRQNFRHIAMWGPVAAGPLIGLAAVLLAGTGQRDLLVPTRVLFWAGAASGLLGFYYHFRGVGQRVDGYVPRNFLVGPPVILPLMFGALSVFGLCAIGWR